MKKVLLLVVVMFLMVSTFSACGTKQNAGTDTNKSSSEESTKKDEKKLRFAYSIMIMDNPYFIAVKQGFEERCKELGIVAIVNDAKYDAPTQFSQVENYIAQKVDAICISPIDAKGIESLVDKGKKEGIVVISEAQGISNADSNIIVNDHDYGVANGTNAAKWINEKLNGEAEVLIIAQDNVEAVKARADGMEEVIKKNCPKATIVARQTGDTPEAAMKIVEAALQAHPNIKVIACVNDSSAIGAAEAVKAANKATADFFVGGADATAQMLEKMKEEGSILRSTVDIDPVGTGKKCVDVMLDYVKNGVKNETFYFEMKPIWQADLK